MMNKLKRFASHRIYVPHYNLLLRNYVVEVEEGSGEVLSYYPFKEEICFTEWIGGLIIISNSAPVLSDIKIGGLSIDDSEKIRSILPDDIDNILLKAYYISDFNVSTMRVSDSSRVIQLN